LLIGCLVLSDLFALQLRNRTPLPAATAAPRVAAAR